MSLLAAAAAAFLVAVAVATRKIHLRTEKNINNSSATSFKKFKKKTIKKCDRGGLVSVACIMMCFALDLCECTKRLLGFILRRGLDGGVGRGCGSRRYQNRKKKRLFCCCVFFPPPPWKACLKIEDETNERTVGT